MREVPGGWESLTGLVLVGGQSARMGRNKALMRFSQTSPPIIEIVVNKLRAVMDEVLLVGSDPAPYGFLGLRQVPDETPGAGSLGGLYSGLAAVRTSHALVVACDMPFLNPALLEYMASVPREYDVLVPAPEKLEPLHAIYSRACLPLIERSLRAERYRMTGWYSEAKVRTIQRAELELYDPALRSFYNVNSPFEWEAATQLGLL